MFTKRYINLFVSADMIIHHEDIIIHHKDMIIHKDIIIHHKVMIIHHKDMIIHKDIIIHHKDMIIHHKEMMHSQTFWLWNKFGPKFSVSNPSSCLGWNFYKDEAYKCLKSCRLSASWGPN